MNQKSELLHKILRIYIKNSREEAQKISNEIGELIIPILNKKSLAVILEAISAFCGMLLISSSENEEDLVFHYEIFLDFLTKFIQGIIVENDPWND